MSVEGVKGGVRGSKILIYLLQMVIVIINLKTLLQFNGITLVKMKMSGMSR